MLNGEFNFEPKTSNLKSSDRSSSPSCLLHFSPYVCVQLDSHVRYCDKEQGRHGPRQSGLWFFTR